MAKSIGAPQELLVFKQNSHTFGYFLETFGNQDIFNSSTQLKQQLVSPNVTEYITKILPEVNTAWSKLLAPFTTSVFCRDKSTLLIVKIQC